MGEDNKDEKKGHLNIMSLIIWGLSLYVLYLAIRALFLME